MTAIIKSIHKFGDVLERREERLAFYHPYLAFLAIFIGMPLCILMAVALSTTLVAFPMALVFGWM